MKRWQHDETGRICEMEQSPGNRWYEIPAAYTIEELTAMPDADLNALAAELRGYRHDPSNAAWYDEHGGRFDYEYEFKPATDRNQSGELLEWAWRTHGILFHIGFTGGASQGYVQFETLVIHRTIPGNTARAETIAFCAAMLAMAGRLK